MEGTDRPDMGRKHRKPEHKGDGRQTERDGERERESSLQPITDLASQV